MRTMKTVVTPWHRMFLLVAPIFAFVLVTTYPYSFGANHVVLADGVVSFKQPGLLTWDEGVLSPEVKRVVVRLVLKSYSNAQTGPARIVTLSRDHLHSNFTIGQEDSDLVIRLRRAASSALGMPPFVIPKVFNSVESQVVAVSIEADALTVEVNGETLLAAPLDSNPFGFWDTSYTLALGNEHTWERPWLGEVHMFQLTIDARKSDMLRDIAVSKPGFLHQLRQRLQLYSPRVPDIFLNLLLMIPMGAITSLAFRRHQILITLLSWLFIATAVEVVQASIPGRFPTIADALLNSMGACLGAWLLVRWRLADSRT